MRRQQPTTTSYHNISHNNHFNDSLQVNIKTDPILLPPLVHLQHDDNDDGTSQRKLRRRIITNITIGIRDRKTGKK